MKSNRERHKQSKHKEIIPRFEPLLYVSTFTITKDFTIL